MTQPTLQLLEHPRLATRYDLLRHLKLPPEDIRALGIDPAVADLNAHGPLNHIEDVVFRVGVRPWALRVWLQPPLGDGVSASCFVSICFEDGGNASHRIRTPLTRKQDNAGSVCRAISVAHAPSW